MPDVNMYVREATWRKILKIVKGDTIEARKMIREAIQEKWGEAR